MMHGRMWMVPVAILLLSGVAVVRCWGPRPAKAQAGCAVDTFKGSYAFHTQGWLPQSGPAGAPMPFAQIGLGVTDGAGNLRLALTSNENGQVAKETFNYTYQVNADCTGSVTPAPGSQAGPADFVLADGGKQLVLVVTLPGFVLSGVGIRQ